MNTESQNIEFKQTWRDILTKNRLQYLEIKVLPSNIPISLNGVYHYRSGSTKQELKGIALQQFLLRKMGRSWDDIPHETATLKRISRTAIDYFVNHAVRAFRMPTSALTDSTETILENLNLLTDDGKLRNAALLLFAENPQRYFPGSEFKIGRFGVSESDLMFQDVVEGNIIQMTEKVIELLRSKYLISNIHYEGLQRVEKLEIPEDALRELINNAICHKDYMGVAIQMKVYNDRIELWNDGLLPDGMTPDDLLKPHKSKPRNKLISAVFYRAGYIETWGRGIEKVCAAFDAEQMQRPKFEFTCGGLNTIIYRKENATEDTHNVPVNVPVNIPANVPVNVPANVPVNVPVNDRQKQILHLMKVDSQVTALQLSEILNVSDKTIKRDIQTLCDLCMIERIGADKNGYWKINSLPEDAPVNVPVNVPVNDRQKQILEFITENNKITALQLSERLNVSDKTIKRDLQNMCEASLIERIGSDKTGYWHIKHNNS